jgi:hypothetical protein
VRIKGIEAVRVIDYNRISVSSIWRPIHTRIRNRTCCGCSYRVDGLVRRTLVRDNIYSLVILSTRTWCPEQSFASAK